MKKDLSSFIAAEMDKALNSEENKKMFSSSSMLEKLAFKRVSEQDLETEIELEVSAKINKTASEKCEECSKDASCDCDCCDEHCDCKKESKASEIVKTLINVSAKLDNAGFEKLAAASILLANKLVVEAKAKKSEKDSKKSDKASGKKSEKESGKKPEKSKGSKDSKDSGKKTNMKERMEKMRKMKDSKKKPASKKK